MGPHWRGEHGSNKAHPSYTRQSNIYHQTLLYHNPDALMRGGGVWAESAKALKTMDDFVAQHPKLASLLPNAGTVAGGAMWIKNFTPAGFLGYLASQLRLR